MRGTPAPGLLPYGLVPRLLLAVLLLASAACGNRPNVLVVTFDTTRADHVGYASGDRKLTPNLDRLAGRGAVFSTAISAQPLTLPSHATIFTGRYPYSHGVRNNGTYVLDKQQVTLAERLSAAGYATHAIVSAFVLDSRFGLDQGFRTYDDDLLAGRRNESLGTREINAATVADKAIAWLDRRKEADEPFLLWLHFYDPHSEYRPPQSAALAYPGEPYKGEIHFADQQLGRVLSRLEQLGLEDDTLIVFSADHGEGLGEHDEAEHAMFIYETTTHVPMLLAGPGVPKRRVDAVVRTADLTPTILELAGIEADTSAFDGASVLPLLEGRSDPPRSAYTESLYGRLNFGWAELRALRDSEWKVIESPLHEIYSLNYDPRETKNLAADQPAGSRRLLARLRQLAAKDPFALGNHQETALDPEIRKQLAALGYLGGSGGTRTGPRPDPKQKRDVWSLFQQAHGLSVSRRYGEAALLLERIADLDPDNLAALLALAAAREEGRQYEAALEAYRAATSVDPLNATAYAGATRVLSSLRRFGEAETLARTLTTIAGDSADGHIALGEIFLAQDRFPEAEAAFREALKVKSDATMAISGLGNTLNRAGRRQEALRILKAGFNREPASSEIAYNLAVVTERLGDTRAASLLYQHVLTLDPQHSMAWNNLGSLFSRAGKREDALRCISRAVSADPDNAEARHNLGALLLAAGRPAEALPHLEKAVQLQPAFFQAAAQHATALVRLGRMDEAVAAWKQIAGAAPDAWLNVAKIELARGNEAAARAALARGSAVQGDRFRALAVRDPQLRSLLSPEG